MLRVPLTYYVAPVWIVASLQVVTAMRIAWPKTEILMRLGLWDSVFRTVRSAIKGSECATFVEGSSGPYHARTARTPTQRASVAAGCNRSGRLGRQVLDPHDAPPRPTCSWQTVTSARTRPATAASAELGCPGFLVVVDDVVPPKEVMASIALFFAFECAPLLFECQQ